MSEAAQRMMDHDVPAGPHAMPPAPLGASASGPRRSPAEEARTLVDLNSSGALGTLCEDGHPWASLVTYGALKDGSPVLLVSHLAEHGRNLARDGRASLMVAQDPSDAEPLAHGRVTLVCDGEQAIGQLENEAREAHIAAVPSAAAYVGFGDFALWVLRVRRVRWIGGYGRMDSVDADGYTAAEPDPTAPGAQYAVEHLNHDHADALLLMAQGLGGYPDASSAQCSDIDRYGLDLGVSTPGGRASTRIGFSKPAERVEDLRSATVELARAARAALAEA